MNVTEDEIRQEFDRIFDEPKIVDDPRAKTTTELAAQYGMSPESMRKRIAKAVRDGLLELVYVRRMRSNGRDQPVVAYRVVRKD